MTRIPSPRGSSRRPTRADRSPRSTRAASGACPCRATAIAASARAVAARTPSRCLLCCFRSSSPIELVSLHPSCPDLCLCCPVWISGAGAAPMGGNLTAPRCHPGLDPGPREAGRRRCRWPRTGVRGRPGPRIKPRTVIRSECGVTKGTWPPVRVGRNPRPDPVDGTVICLCQRLAPNSAYPDRTAVKQVRP